MAENNQGVQKIVRLGLILFTITVITGVILGFVNEITKGPIAATQTRLKKEALSGALPEAKEFLKLELAGDAQETVQEVQKGESGGRLVGYCLTVVTKGYAGPVETVVGIKEDGTLSAIRIINQSETPGLGAKAPLPAFSGQFQDKAAGLLTVVKAQPQAAGDIQAISGATITSEAVTSGVNAAIDYWKNNLAGGGMQ